MCFFATGWEFRTRPSARQNSNYVPTEKKPYIEETECLAFCERVNVIKYQLIFSSKFDLLTIYNTNFEMFFEIHMLSSSNLFIPLPTKIKYKLEGFKQILYRPSGSIVILFSFVLLNLILVKRKVNISYIFLFLQYLKTKYVTQKFCYMLSNTCNFNLLYFEIF